MSFGSLIKYGLTRCGAYSSAEMVRLLNAAVNFLEAGRWMRAHGFQVPRRVDRREELFDLVGREVGSRQVLYLEFGVFEGEAMRYWSRLLTHPCAMLHGFDSFAGLPESWNQHVGKGLFDTQGVLPRVDDLRVCFFPGWFDEVLPKYQVPEHEVLVVNIDADLYSSTILVLRSLREHIRPGTYLYFDEFCWREHELKAFDEFLVESGLRFTLRGADKTLDHVLFQCVP